MQSPVCSTGAISTIKFVSFFSPKITSDTSYTYYTDQPRLTQSRSTCGAFYVKDVESETVKKIAEVTGITDVQAHLI